MKNSSKWNFQVCSSLGSKLEKGFDRDRPAYLLIWYDTCRDCLNSNIKRKIKLLQNKKNNSKTYG
jgi:hypothetical protein